MGLDRNPAAKALYRTDPLRFFRRNATCETNDAINGHKEHTHMHCCADCSSSLLCAIAP